MNVTPHACRRLSREPETNPQKPCPGCLTNPRSKTGILCGACWRRTPKSLANLFRRGATKKAAIQQILEHFRRERDEPKLTGFNLP